MGKTTELSEDEQIRLRLRTKQEMLTDSLMGLSEVIDPNPRLSSLRHFKSASLRDAVNRILAYYKIDTRNLPEEKSLGTILDTVNYYIAEYDIAVRDVALTPGWSKDLLGPALVRKKSGELVAMIPDGFGNLWFKEYHSEKRIRMTKDKEADFKNFAISFYRKFPARAMTSKDLFVFMLKSLSKNSYASLLLTTALVSAFGMITPSIIKTVFSSITLFYDYTPLYPALFVIMFAALAVFLMQIVKSQINSQIVAKIESDVRAASMLRVLYISPEFFRKYSTGDLAKRMQILPLFTNAVTNGVLTTGLSCLFSVIYILQLLSISPPLAGVTALIVIAMVVFTVLLVRRTAGNNIKKMHYTTRSNALLYSIISGITSVKITASEKSFFAKWASIYKEETKYDYKPGIIVKYSKVFYTAITLIGMLIIYYAAIHNNVPYDSYMAFVSIYGLLSGMFLMLQTTAPQAALVAPILKTVQPIFDLVPEKNETAKAKPDIDGSIKIQELHFKYAPGLPEVISHLDLKIEAGEYIAIIGKSGCGKSTLMRLLLGFEEPTKGSIYLGNNDLKTMDKQAYRQKLGIVMQDSKLFAGSIFQNISIANPTMSEDDAWEVAKKAGIYDDIKSMPMGMNTLVDENATCISGGQKQRIIIARALAGNPKIVIFDEATSALDNITQKTVSESLDKMQCTRIVIAHRLSTIRHADRILVFDGGHIIEEGTYDQLMNQQGFFAELVKRQQV